MLISQSTKQEWWRDGAVCLRQVFNQEWLALLEDGVEASRTSPSELSKDYAKAGEGSFFTDHAMHRRVPQIRDFIADSPIAEIGADLLESEKINLIDDHLLVKEPGTANPTYWHQDQPYFNFAGEDFCSFWIPLDTVDETNGTLRFAIGSHRWQKEFRPVLIGKGDVVEQAEEFDGLAPDIDADPEEYETRSWNLAPGDCLAFHGKMLHGAFPNLSSGSPRRAISIRLTGDDIVWTPRQYAPAEKDQPELTPGGSIDCDDYPVVWPKNRCTL